MFPGLILLLLEFMLSPGKRSLRAFLLIPVVSLALWGLPLGTARAGIFSSPVGKGIKAYEAKDFGEAKKQFIEAQIENPEDKRIYYNLGTAAYMNKEYEEAVNHFSKALDAKDAGLRHNARFNLGNTHYQMGHMDEAIKEYEAVLKEFPDDREVRITWTWPGRKNRKKNPREIRTKRNRIRTGTSQKIRRIKTLRTRNQGIKIRKGIPTTPRTGPRMKNRINRIKAKTRENRRPLLSRAGKTLNKIKVLNPRPMTVRRSSPRDPLTIC